MSATLPTLEPTAAPPCGRDHVLSTIRCLAPLEREFTFPAALSDPFAPERIEALDSLATCIRRSPALRREPSAQALAYWLRRAHQTKLADEFRQRHERPDSVLVPAGHVLQIAPQNVDTLFLYSFAVGFVTGNASIVRVSTRPSELVQGLLDSVNACLLDQPALRDSTRFITYEHNDDVTRRLSDWCDQRIVWGGDDTVARLRGIAVPPHASERSFATKFSGAVLSGPAVLALEESALQSLADRLFVDITTFGQHACSSPQVLYWVGLPAECDWARQRLVTALDARAVARGWEASASDVARRTQFAFEMALDHACRVDLSPRSFTHIVAISDTTVGDSSTAEASLGGDHASCGGGLLRHIDVTSLEQIAAQMSAVDQTLTHFGLATTELQQLARLAGRRGLDRIVPIGQALDFETTWDGFDLLADCTRTVRVRLT